MKIFSKILLVAVTLIVVAGVLLLSRINTDSNKRAIEGAVRNATGYELTIGGDLSLDLFPNPGLSLEDVRLRNPAYPQELGSTSRMVLRVDLAPLLSRRIIVQEARADDFHVNYFVNADGNSIWAVDDVTGSDTSTPTIGRGDGAESTAPDLVMERIRIADATIDVQDISRGFRYRLDQLNLETTNANLNGQPFPVAIGFDFENNGMSAPTPVNLHGNVTADLSAGSVSIDEIRASITPMLINGSLVISGLDDSLTYSGEMSAASFDLMGLLQSLGIVETSSEPALSLSTDRQLAFELAFDGDSEQASLSSFTLNFADTEITADANARMATDLSPMSVSYRVNVGHLDLTPLLSADEAPTDSDMAAEAESSSTLPEGNPAAQYQPQAELPVELINALTLLGSIAIESVAVNDMRFEDISVFTNMEDGVLDIELPPITAFEGSVRGTLRLNTQERLPVLDATLTLSDVNLLNLAPSLSRFNTLTGFLQAESTYAMQGSSSEAMLNSLSGNTAFSITENSVDISVIKQVFTAIAALSPTGEAIQQWPDVIRFNEMSGNHRIQQGLIENQELNLQMDNFDVSGTGGFNLDTRTFDYDLLFTVLGEPYAQTIQINELYHNVSWPVDCSAAFGDTVNQYCRPDFTRVREIFTQIGSNAVRNRLQEAISDQAPEQLLDSARGLLRSILN